MLAVMLMLMMIIRFYCISPRTATSFAPPVLLMLPSCGMANLVATVAGSGPAALASTAAAPLQRFAAPAAGAPLRLFTPAMAMAAATAALAAPQAELLARSLPEAGAPHCTSK